MADRSRTLKLSILGDVEGLNKSLKAANADVENSSSKMGDFSKKAGLAFAAAGAAASAYAIKLGVDGVKAAMEDEKAQRILALTLENTTGATKDQIAAVEDYITKTSLSIGVTDDKLRPAYARLVRSTKDTEEAQKLLNLSLDIASATGKPLEAIANSLGKAYDGNTNALGKLGLGIDQSILKTKDFNLVYENLRGSFKGFAEGEAQTFQGRLDRLKVAFDEAKETIGFKLLPIIQQLVQYVVDKVLPALGKFADFFQPISDAISRNKETFIEFGEFIQKYLVPVLTTVLGGAIKGVGIIAGGVIDVIGAVIRTIESLVSGAITGINAIIKAYNAIPLLPNIPLIQQPSSSKSYSSISGVLGSSASVAAPSIPAIAVPTTSAGIASATSSAAVASSYAAGSYYDPMSGNTPDATPYSSPNISVTVNQGIVGDPEAAARTVVDVLNRSFFRGTGGANALLFG
jgi:hypothetical protein